MTAPHSRYYCRLIHATSLPCRRPHSEHPSSDETSSCHSYTVRKNIFLWFKGVNPGFVNHPHWCIGAGGSLSEVKSVTPLDGPSCGANHSTAPSSKRVSCA